MTYLTKRQLPPGIELVLGAGGVEGPAHIGVLRCLEERQVSLGKITGASVGALIAAFIANGYSSKQIKEIFLSESFRYPSWDIWSRCLRTPDPSSLFFPWTTDVTTWMNWYVKL
ncbi:MAG: patatin-like phospholipase family protein, partial [Cyanobacteria bacterium]|nr:patatin-like phospholipase family protein [Cyanobacteriota bacterium]